MTPAVHVGSPQPLSDPLSGAVMEDLTSTHFPSEPRCPPGDDRDGQRARRFQARMEGLLRGVRRPGLRTAGKSVKNPTLAGACSASSVQSGNDESQACDSYR